MLSEYVVSLHSIGLLTSPKNRLNILAVFDGTILVLGIVCWVVDGWSLGS